MTAENKFIKHIVETKRGVNEWPEWKRNLLDSDDNSSKSFKTLSSSEMNMRKISASKK